MGSNHSYSWLFSALSSYFPGGKFFLVPNSLDINIEKRQQCYDSLYSTFNLSWRKRYYILLSLIYSDCVFLEIHHLDKKWREQISNVYFFLKIVFFNPIIWSFISGKFYLHNFGQKLLTMRLLLYLWKFAGFFFCDNVKWTFLCCTIFWYNFHVLPVLLVDSWNIILCKSFVI